MKLLSQDTARKTARRTQKTYGAQSVGFLFPKITKHIFEKYGFSTAALVSDWAAIVGSDLARFTRPEKLKWPMQKQDFSSEMTAPRSGATLVLRVEGARSLEIQFGSSQIIERINTYFGYNAVTDIRIMQAPLKLEPLSEFFKKDMQQAKKPKKISPPKLNNITCSALKDALQRMAYGRQNATD